MVQIRFWRTHSTKTMRKVRLVVSLALAGSLLLSGCQSLGAGNPDQVDIGAFVPLTGSMAPLGTDMRKGYELAVENHGPINGHPVNLEVSDSQGKPIEGILKSQALVEARGSDLLVGGASSSVVLAMMKQGKRMQVPIVTTNGQSPKITGESCNRYTFRTNPDDIMAAKSTEIMMKNRPELKKGDWYIVYHDQVWGRDNKAAFEQIDGLNIVGSSGRPFGTADWSSVLQEIQSKNPDSLYLALASGDDIPSFVRQARSFGLQQKMLLPIGAPDTMVRTLGKDGEGLLASGLHGSWRLNTPGMAPFVNKYHKKYGEPPGLQAITAYAGMTLTLKALDNSKNLNTDTIIKSLENAEANTVLGPLSIRDEDHQGTASTWSAVIERVNDPRFGKQYSWTPLVKNSWQEVKTSSDGCHVEGDHVSR